MIQLYGLRDEFNQLLIATDKYETELIRLILDVMLAFFSTQSNALV